MIAAGVGRNCLDIFAIAYHICLSLGGLVGKFGG